MLWVTGAVVSIRSSRWPFRPWVQGREGGLTPSPSLAFSSSSAGQMSEADFSQQELQLLTKLVFLVSIGGSTVIIYASEILGNV